VVVDASDDWVAGRERIAGMIAAAGRDIPLRYVPAQKKSLPAQRNQGVAQASADILFLIDDDSFMHPGCAAEIMAIYEADSEGVLVSIAATKSDLDPRAALAGGPAAAHEMRKEQQRAVAGSRLKRFVWREILMQSVAANFVDFDLPNRRFAGEIPAALSDRVRPAPYIPGCQMTARREMLLEEPFEGALLSYAAVEDRDASYRFGRHGLIVQALAAPLHHSEVQMSRLKRRQVTAMHLLNVAFITRKNTRAPLSHLGAVWIMTLRRLLAEFLKDAATKRWDFPQLQGVLIAMRHLPDLCRRKEPQLSAWYEGLQREILAKS